MDDKKTPPKRVDMGGPTPVQSTNQASTNATGPKPKTNGLAIAAIILAFLFPLIGLILGIVALSQIKKNKEGGKGLAVASIVISVVIMVAGLLTFFLVLFAFNTALKNSGVNVNGNGSVSVKNNEGESLTVGNAKLPDGFPSDVPVYKPSDVITSLKTKEGYNVTLVTADSSTQVSDFYKSKLAENGWSSSDSEVNFGTLSGQTYTKGDQQLVVIITNDPNSKTDKKTSVNLTVGKKTSTQ